MFKNLPTPTIFAHRGSSAYAPENTLAAFQLAIKQKATAIELDAKLCASGEVVVIHDQTVDRTTNGHGRVLEMPLTALKALDAGDFFDPAFQRETIPTLAEVFQTVGTALTINVELTNYASPRDSLPERVIALVKDHGLEDSVFFSSFNPLALRRARKLAPQIPIALLTLSGWAGWWARTILGRWGNYQALHPEKSDAQPGLIQRQHRLGRRVHVYTVNQAAEMQSLFANGVDGIFTDDPPLALKALAAYQPTTGVTG
ncbi:MAG: hypothetical protein JW862_10350 [Anaerolineales bacterium]|nr:hypothetical protein [Anaerolineales bacterium]